MSARQLFAFALRQLRREWSAGELAILLLALIIAIASHTAINHFTTRLAGTMAANANDVIGGDLALVGNRPASDAMLREAERLGLRAASAMQFSSVIGANGEILLVGVKAVDRGYPLKGKLKIAEALYGATTQVQSGPPAGEAWVESRVLRALGINLGDAFELGSAQLAATRVLAFEPDRGRNFYSLTPRVMIHQDDLALVGNRPASD
ncbi:MAG: ABC transporter permease, partial [bacterium]